MKNTVNTVNANIANANAANANTAVPPINKDDKNIINQIRCFALDMDGTVYLGNEWIDGAVEFLKKIEESGRSYVFVTNNSSKTPAVYVDKLHRMGLDVGEDKIITSAQAAICYLEENFPGKGVFLLGNAMLQKQFEDSGIRLDEKHPDVVVTAFDTSLNYDKMCKVCDFVREGLPYIATHPDYNCPTETGFVPDIGAIHAFIHASAFRYPDCIIGKPNGYIMDYLVKRTGAGRNNIAIAGDRLYTDIAAGVNNGFKSILVLSGEASYDDVKTSEVIPDLVFASVKDIMAFLPG